MAPQPQAKPIDPDRDALEAILGTHFMLERASRWCLRAVLAALVPSACLWVHAHHPLPDLVAWFAQVTWFATVLLAVAFAAAAVKWSRALDAELPATRRFAGVQFAAGLPPLSATLLVLAAVPSTALWLHAAAPAVLSADVLTFCARSWLGLTLTGAGVRAAEALR